MRLAAGQRLEQRVPHLRGDGLAMLDLTCDGPLLVEVAMSADHQHADWRQAEAALSGGQSRGLYLAPDRDLAGQFPLERGAIQGASRLERPLVAGGDQLKGNYGAIANLSVRLLADPSRRYRRVVGLLVARGGTLGAVVDGRPAEISACGAVVLFNREVIGEQTWDYTYSLPANSFAPVGLVLIPLPL